MKKSVFGGLQKMSKYLSANYYSGSILERASYKKNRVKVQKVSGSLIEQKNMKKETLSTWKRVREVILK